MVVGRKAEGTILALLVACVVVPWNEIQVEAKCGNLIKSITFEGCDFQNVPHWTADRRQ